MRLLVFEQLRPQKGIPYHRDHLRRLCKAGKFSAPVNLSDQRIAWVEAEVDDWIAQKARARLVKSGIIRGVSIGFDAQESEPLDPRNPRGGQRITRSEMLECSFVSVPADTGATVVARSYSAGTFQGLAPLPAEAIRRAVGMIARGGKGLAETFALRQAERLIAEVPVAPAVQTWLLHEGARKRDAARYSADARLAELRRLAPTGDLEPSARRSAASWGAVGSNSWGNAA